MLTGAAIGAGITGLLAIIFDNGNKHMVAPMLAIWVILAIVALGAAAMNRYRRRG